VRSIGQPTRATVGTGTDTDHQVGADNNTVGDSRGSLGDATPQQTGNGSADGVIEAGIKRFGDAVGPVDTDQDGLSNEREQRLGTDPIRSDTDNDSLLDATEVLRGTDHSDRDTDGDGLMDGLEVEIGTDPTVVDTDDDALTDQEEWVLETDPTVADTDGDGLQDGWEYSGMTPSGVALPDSDPLSKDVFVQIDYAAGVEQPNGTVFAAVNETFADMPVRNPDNTTGIDVHFREPRTLDEHVTYTGGNFWALKRQYYDTLGARAGIDHQIVVANFTTNTVGYGEVGGAFSVVAAGSGTETQKHVIVHELLHNIVGTIDAPNTCPGDPTHYCGDGLLQPHIPTDGDKRLPGPVAKQLEREGFAD